MTFGESMALIKPLDASRRSGRCQIASREEAYTLASCGSSQGEAEVRVVA